MKFLKTFFLSKSSNFYCRSFSPGVKAWGQFVDKLLKHIFCGRPQSQSRADGQLTGVITGEERDVEVR